MSKSKGNLVLVSALRETGNDPMAIRLVLLAHHYRSDWEWVDADLERAIERLARWRKGLERLTAPAAAPVVAALRGSLGNDLDAPRALELVDEWTTTVGDDDEAPDQVRAAIDALLGLAL